VVGFVPVARSAFRTLSDGDPGLAARLLLAFLSYMASMGGLIMGVIGTALYARERQN
jgi:hypothetical protein